MGIEAGLDRGDVAVELVELRCRLCVVLGQFGVKVIA